MLDKYTPKELDRLLDELLEKEENVWLEFKTNLSKAETIGKYISALANMAAFVPRSFGYMVWGIEDGTRKIVGTSFDPVKQKVGELPLAVWLKRELTPAVEFKFYPWKRDGKWVVLLEIEAAYRTPIRFQQIPYARTGSSLMPLGDSREIEERIYRTIGRDWSAEILLDADLNALDPEALSFARRQYKEKHRNDSFAEDIDGWDDLTFLNKAKLAIDGKLTRAALILLGKPESVHWLRPSVLRMTWQLKDKDGNVKDYQHFAPPFLLTVEQLYRKVRNLTIRTMPDGTLFPMEVTQYDSWVFREVLHNCIAHQDYRLCCDIVITEYPDSLSFANAGAFLPETVERALKDNDRPRFYPNRQLVEAMVELKMIDSIGSGIRKMYTTQRENYMPLPDFEIAPDSVRVTLYGKIIDIRYSRLLIERTDLAFDDIFLLDRVQKKLSIDKRAADRLRKQNLIEGRFPNIFPAVWVAAETEQLERYLDNKGYDDDFYVQRILEFICAKGYASKSDIRNLLKKHFPDVLTEQQKENKISNLLSVTMAKRGLIQNEKGTGGSHWVLTEAGMVLCRKSNQKCRKKCRKF